MEKCKNIECNNKTVGKRVYCSLTCRNIYVNKYLRDYSKNGAGLSEEKEYYDNPKKCKKCNEIIKYEQRRNEYCSHSCSASETNKQRKGIVHKLTTQGRDGLVKCAIKNFFGKKTAKKRIEAIEIKKKQFLQNPVFCKHCKKELNYNQRVRKLIFCSFGCRVKNGKIKMTEFQRYKRDCIFKFNLSDFNKEFNFKLIEEYGWYKPTNKGNNLNGVSRDHMYSIREGFDNNIEAGLIAHPANCKLVLQKENSSKHKKSSISIDELKTRIEDWNKKYN